MFFYSKAITKFNLKLNNKILEKNILISIVVPTYNNEKFLDKCVESILSQTYHEFELLIINDGSTDNTIHILQPYLKKDQRIKLHNTKNKGVSSARNLGISKAKGEYICFIDSDDWVEKDYLSQFVSKIQNPKTLIIQEIFQNRNSKKYTNSLYDIKKDLDVLMLEYHFMSLGSPFAKLYHTETIKKNNLTFNNLVSYGEDQMFFFQYITYINSIYTLNYRGYHYNHNSTSLSTKIHPFISFYTYHLSLIDFIKYISDFCKSEKVLYKIYKTDWDIVEASIDHGFIFSKEVNPDKSLKILSKTLNKNYYKYSNSVSRKIIYILLKTSQYKFLLFYKKMIFKYKTKKKK